MNIKKVAIYQSEDGQVFINIEDYVVPLTYSQLVQSNLITTICRIDGFNYQKFINYYVNSSPT